MKYSMQQISSVIRRDMSRLPAAPFNMIMLLYPFVMRVHYYYITFAYPRWILQGRSIRLWRRSPSLSAARLMAAPAEPTINANQFNDVELAAITPSPSSFPNCGRTSSEVGLPRVCILDLVFLHPSVPVPEHHQPHLGSPHAHRQGPAPDAEDQADRHEGPIRLPAGRAPHSSADLLLLPPAVRAQGSLMQAAIWLPQWETCAPAKIIQFSWPPCRFSSFSDSIFAVLFTIFFAGVFIFAVFFTISIISIFNFTFVRAALR